ncbi:CYTH and CHAD domain-containing protein [Massilia sp. IC2-476]|uniref:CYTH and CHAD domain-containing protein n=1 Tax=Massilia sp. IC2-476 TaxID=2887199 RepID=UPI001D10BF9D|nr:CYTH and CHAD domain-containing protein [Massilia sp. IC2-476]MCC2971104.1 CHAD domain-containing protein [Massilia sp. IC2-476]
METELKLKLATADVARMREHPLLAELSTAAPREHELLDTYYDTPELDLWRGGLTLRVRRDGEAWIQTVKTASAGSPVLHERGEWESPLEGPQPDPADLSRQVKPQRLRELLRSPAIVGQLQPVFTNTTHRTTWDIALPGGQLVECALDSGSIDANGNGRNAEIGELELELKHGNPTRLFELALALHEDIPLEVANDSKAARGYALLQDEVPPPVKATPVRLGRKMRMEEALQCMGLNCMAQIESNVPGVLARSAESLHQMRVGLRRLRALLDMFRDLAPLPPELQEELDWLSGELGATRDWDVLADSTLPAISGIHTEALQAAAREHARNLHRNMLPTLHSPRYTHLMLRMNGWLRGRQWRPASGLGKDDPLHQHALDGLVPLVRKAQKRLRKRIEALDENDAPARHRVRIAAKKARYAAEFFRDLLPEKEVKAYIKCLSQLQDRLGHLNDLAVAGRLLPVLENGGHAHDGSYARGWVAGSADAGAQGLREALGKVARLKLV